MYLKWFRNWCKYLQESPRSSALLCSTNRRCRSMFSYELLLVFRRNLQVLPVVSINSPRSSITNSENSNCNASITLSDNILVALTTPSAFPLEVSSSLIGFVWPNSTPSSLFALQCSYSTCDFLEAEHSGTLLPGCHAHRIDAISSYFNHLCLLL